MSRQRPFEGSYYLDLPLLLTKDGVFHKADEVLCFDQDEKITEQEKVYRLMGFQKFLFVPHSPVNKLWLSTERNIKDRLFKRALTTPDITSEALEYLDSVDYVYLEKKLFDKGPLRLTSNPQNTFCEKAG